MIRKLIVVLLVMAVATSALPAQPAAALSGGEFQSGRIVDDSIFFDGAAVSPQDIQLFLNSKVPVCDTQGQQMRGSVTRAQYAASQGYGAPYICLKDYRETTPAKSAEAGLCNGMSSSNRSAAEIIYEVGRSCGVSQAALIVLLQKEQSLITDDWPWSIQYRSATGYGCPDTAPCDAEYYGFFNQVYNAARQFKKYGRDESTFRYRAFRTNYIQYNPNTACGGSNVFIQSQATAGLYNYTPYQPNPSALANLYGEGDGCGAYGNRNFWRMYNDWFGTTNSGENLWRVIRTQTDGRLFLQVGNTKRWIPTGEIYNDWTLNQYPINTISDDTFNAIPTIPALTRLGNDGQYNYVVDGGRRHYLPSNMIDGWGYGGVIAAPVSSLIHRITEVEPMNRIIRDPASNYWLIDGNMRHAIATKDLAAWGMNQTSVVTLQTPYLNAIAVGTPLDRYVSFNNTSYIADQGSLIRMPDSDTASNWYAGSYLPIGASAGALMPVKATAGLLVQASDNPNWYMITGGTKYYISSGSVAQNWGMAPESKLVVSPDFLNALPVGHVLTNLALDTTTQMVYILDGQKHHVGNSDLLNTLDPNPGPNIISVPASRLNKIGTGTPYSKPLVIVKGTPHLWILDQGKRYHIDTGDIYNAFNAWDGSLSLADSLVASLPQANGQLSGVVKDTQGTAYLVDRGKKTVINGAVSDSWQSATTVQLSNSFLSLIPTSNASTITSRYLGLGAVTYFVDKGQKTRISSELAANYPGSSSAVRPANDSIPTRNGQSAYMIASTDDQKSWLIANGTKTALSFAEQLTYGYLSTYLQPAQASNNFLAQFPTAANHSLLIRKQNSGGVKMLDFGHALGFPDGSTLTNTIGSSNPVLVVDDATFDSFPLVGSTSRVVKDDSGKLFLMDAGQRRWISNGSAYQRYAGIPITYLYGTTMAMIPEGQPIN